MFLKVDTSNYLVLSRHLQVGGEIFEVGGEKWCKILAPFFYTYKGKFLQVKF